MDRVDPDKLSVLLKVGQDLDYRRREVVVQREEPRHRTERASLCDASEVARELPLKIQRIVDRVRRELGIQPVDLRGG